MLAYVDAVREAGVDVPAIHGRDTQGRQVTEFVTGGLATDSGPLSLSELCRVGRIVRAIHDASAAYELDSEATWSTLIPALGAELICHNDLSPWNLLIGERWVFIDWDAAAPSTWQWDLVCAAQAFILNDASADPRVAARALAAFIDGYGADDELRAVLPVTMGQRTSAMVTQFVRNNEPVWVEAVQIIR